MEANGMLLDAIMKVEDFPNKFIAFCTSRHQCGHLAQLLQTELSKLTRLNNRQQHHKQASAAPGRNMEVSRHGSLSQQASPNIVTQPEAASTTDNRCPPRIQHAPPGTSVGTSTSSFYLHESEVAEALENEQPRRSFAGHEIDNLKIQGRAEQEVQGLAPMEPNIPPSGRPNPQHGGNVKISLTKSGGTQCEEDVIRHRELQDQLSGRETGSGKLNAVSDLATATTEDRQQTRVKTVFQDVDGVHPIRDLVHADVQSDNSRGSGTEHLLETSFDRPTSGPTSSLFYIPIHGPQAVVNNSKARQEMGHDQRATLDPNRDPVEKYQKQTDQNTKCLSSKKDGSQGEKAIRYFDLTPCAVLGMPLEPEAVTGEKDSTLGNTNSPTLDLEYSRNRESSSTHASGHSSKPQALHHEISLKTADADLFPDGDASDGSGISASIPNRSLLEMHEPPLHDSHKSEDGESFFCDNTVETVQLNREENRLSKNMVACNVLGISSKSRPLDILSESMESTLDEQNDQKACDILSDTPSVDTDTSEEKCKEIQGIPTTGEEKCEEIQGIPTTGEEKYEEIQGIPTTGEEKCEKSQGIPITGEEKCEERQGIPTTREEKCEESQGIPSTREEKCEERQGIPTTGEQKCEESQGTLTCKEHRGISANNEKECGENQSSLAINEKECEKRQENPANTHTIQIILASAIVIYIVATAWYFYFLDSA